MLLTISKEQKEWVFHKAAAFKNREHWYSLPIKKAPILWTDLRWEKHLCYLNLDNVLFEHLFYGINPKESNLVNSLCGYLNSTITWLLVEILGRVDLGQGAIRLVGVDLKNFQ
ncbi:MAG: hypothetical protein QXG12_06815 [Thermoproteota archaeon]